MLQGSFKDHVIYIYIYTIFERTLINSLHNLHTPYSIYSRVAVDVEGSPSLPSFGLSLAEI